MNNTLIDTDVLIWYLRGNKKAYDTIMNNNFSISAVTHMELIQGLRDKNEFRTLQNTLNQWNIKTLQISEDISLRALFYVQEHYLSNSLQLADALIASTCIHHGLKLITANDKHYKIIKDLDMEIFRP